MPRGRRAGRSSSCIHITRAHERGGNVIIYCTAFFSQALSRQSNTRIFLKQTACSTPLCTNLQGFNTTLRRGLGKPRLLVLERKQPQARAPRLGGSLGYVSATLSPAVYLYTQRPAKWTARHDCPEQAPTFLPRFSTTIRPGTVPKLLFPRAVSSHID